ncbi:MAG: hypothetical protein JWR10_675 [Rubritepida sp.]|nr:hypothetical protein [Rubritepida sp.]
MTPTNFAVLLIDCRVDSEPGHPWVCGTLPINGAGTASERGLRGAYFHPRAAGALYGNDTDGRRYHRETEEPAPDGQSKLVALELLRYVAPTGAANALLVLHVQLPNTPEQALDAVAVLARYGSTGEQMRLWLAGLLEGTGQLSAESHRAFCAVFVVARGQPPNLHDQLPRSPDWDAKAQWLFHLAAATSPEDFPPHPDDDALLSDRLFFSASWEALVLRDGAAYLMDADADAGFRADAYRYFRSIYTDAVLLGAVQRVRLHQIADEVAGLGDPANSVEPLLRLQREVTGFRNTYWWEHVTGHGFANQILRAYQHQHLLAEVAGQIFTGLAESADQARVIAADRQSVTAARGNALVGLVTIIGLPFGVALATVQALNSSQCNVWLAFSVAAAVALILASTPPGRAALRPLWRRDTRKKLPEPCNRAS